MNRDEFIGKLEMIYVGDRNAFDEIVDDNQRLKNEVVYSKVELDRLNNIRLKALEFIYKELIPENVNWDYDECIFSDLPVERIKPLVDILELKENKYE